MHSKNGIMHNAIKTDFKSAVNSLILKLFRIKQDRMQQSSNMLYIISTKDWILKKILYHTRQYNELSWLENKVSITG